MYKEMRDAILRQPTAVTYECANFMDKPWASDEAAERVCNIWSVSDDVPDSFHEWTVYMAASNIKYMKLYILNHILNELLIH